MNFIKAKNIKITNSVIHSPSITSTLSPLRQILKSPTSVQNSGKRLPICKNHKRKKASYFVQTQDKEIIYFCQKCGLQTIQQGFRLINITECQLITLKQCSLFAQMKERLQYQKKLKNDTDDLQILKDQLDLKKSQFEGQIAQLSSCQSKRIQIMFQRLLNQIISLKKLYKLRIERQFFKKRDQLQKLVLKVELEQLKIEEQLKQTYENLFKCMTEPLNILKQNIIKLSDSKQKQRQKVKVYQADFKRVLQNACQNIHSIDFQFIQKLQNIKEFLNFDRLINQIQKIESPQECELVNKNNILLEFQTSDSLI